MRYEPRISTIGLVTVYFRGIYLYPLTTRSSGLVRRPHAPSRGGRPLNAGVRRHMKYMALVAVMMAWPSQSATPDGFPLASGTYMFRMVDREYSHGKDLFIYGRASVIVRDSRITVVYLGSDHGFKWGDIIDEGQLTWSVGENTWVIGDDDPDDGCPTEIDPDRRLVSTC